MFTVQAQDFFCLYKLGASLFMICSWKQDCFPSSTSFISVRYYISNVVETIVNIRFYSALFTVKFSNEAVWKSVHCCPVCPENILSVRESCESEKEIGLLLFFISFLLSQILLLYGLILLYIGLSLLFPNIFLTWLTKYFLIHQLSISIFLSYNHIQYLIP